MGAPRADFARGLNRSLFPGALCVRGSAPPIGPGPLPPGRQLCHWRRRCAAHQFDKHSIESFEIGIHQDFHSLQLPLRLVAFKPRKRVAVGNAVEYLAM